jgi:hypothetical protein
MMDFRLSGGRAQPCYFDTRHTAFPTSPATNSPPRLSMATPAGRLAIFGEETGQHLARHA